MRRLIATWTGGLLAAAGACNGALADPVAWTALVPAPTERHDRLSEAFATSVVATPAVARQMPPKPIEPQPVASAPPVVSAPAAAESPAPVSGEMTGSVDKGDAAAGHEPAAAAAVSPEASEPELRSEPVVTSRSPMPFDIIRTMEFLQDQVARGNGRAIGIQAVLLKRFGPVLVNAEPSVWQDVRNRRAAILFALSGGPPDVLRRLIDSGAFDDETKPIAEGALFYVANDMPGAEKRLSAIDMSAMEPGLAAHLNLVLGQLKQADHPADAVVHLDRARLLAPGGLIEEAALRLEVVLVDTLGDHARADNLARQYFDRFSASSYAANFQARFAAVYAERGAADAKAALATVLDITARLGGADRRALLLAVSRRSLLAGNLEFARLSGVEALKIEGADEQDLQRGNLYAAAAGLAAPDDPGAASDLQTIDRTRLLPADIGLLDAATSVLSRIDAPPPAEPASLDPTDVASSPVLDRAKKLLDAVAGDLGEKSE